MIYHTMGPCEGGIQDSLDAIYNGFHLIRVLLETSSVVRFNFCKII